MASRDIIVIGTSAGGLGALTALVEDLPPELPASVFVVMHVSGVSHLAGILRGRGKLPVTEAVDGQPIERGHIYIAPPSRHLVLQDGHMGLSHGPRENRSRPAIDPLFRAAARLYRERVIGVILTGTLDDGSAGLFAVKSRGGLAVVQDPDDAFESEMPRNALRYIKADHCVPLSEIGPLLARLAGSEAPDQPTETHVDLPPSNEKPPGLRRDALSFVCPECHGPLYEAPRETHDGGVQNFSCQTGHSFSPLALSSAHSEALERSLWIALRTLNERVALHETLAAKEIDPDMAQRLSENAVGAREDARLIEEIINRL